MKIKLVKYLILSFTLTLGFSLEANEKNGIKYEKYVNEIVNQFANEMKKEFGLHCYGSGGKMPNDVEEIDVMFSSNKKINVDEARKIEVAAVQKFLKIINNHSLIRPYLREYPFNSNRVGVSITFSGNDHTPYLDGSVALVFLVKNTIFYEKKEKKKIISPPVYSGSTGEIVYPEQERIKVVQ